ncbi:fibronectin type III domain-containing protein [Longitalea arenae]|uniref:fibronectin type III domain-containing protein n=1 Tax=Longitalea arenae TaxID=2812558 RepID=UPI0019689E65|nr:fibronectin type III domain-containing protein [Longitalea arenae]
MGLITFKRERDIVSLCQRVIEKMEENKDVFANPPAALADIARKLPAFQASLVKAKSRDMEMVAVKNQLKAEIMALLEEVAGYVAVVCDGNRAMLLSSGFYVTEEQTGSKAPSIQSIEVEIGEPGVATIRVKKQSGAVAYVHQYAMEPPGPNTVWQGEGSTFNNHTFNGLISDKRYWFRIVAIGRKGQKAYSPIVSRAIQ